MRNRFALAATLAGLLFVSSMPVTAGEGVSLLVNARIHTVDPSQPEASAMAWDANGQLLAVGDRKVLEQRFPDANRVDAGGHAVTPGLIDAHGHLLGLGQSKRRVDLVGAVSLEENVARVVAFARDQPGDGWLLGRGWDQNDWPVQRFPTAADLDKAFPDRPVWLRRIDGHAGWANSAAMRIAARAAGRDLDGDWQPDGGHIQRVNGKATGVFIDSAGDLIGNVVPQDDPAEVEAALAAAFDAAVAVGLTGVHDAGTPLSELGVMRRMADAGKIPLRVYAMADADNAALDTLCALGPYRHPGGRLQMRTVKFYIDGALGSRGAALLADYSDDPHNRGLLLVKPEEFERVVRKAKGCGVQVATHAIGDRGNRLVLDTYEKVLGADADGDLRWRDEHSQIIDPADIPRFAKLGVIASMQPSHATSDGPWAETRLGAARMAGAYAWRSLLDSGARLAFGSDFPVEFENPMLGLYAAVTRQDREGHPPGGWQPSQRLTPAEALRGFTLDAAYAGFAENEVGSLKPGKRADFVILSDDPLSIDASKIDDIKVLSTWVDGEAVYRAGD